jgi:peptidoglycan/LPS O-acetylase OafA/YrhL
LAALATTKRTRALIPACLLAVPVLLLTVRFVSIVLDDPYAVTMAASHLRLDALLFGVGIRCLAEYLPELFQALRAWRGWLVLAGLLLWSVNLFIEPDTVLIRTVGLAGTYLGGAAFLVAAFHTHAADFGGLKRFADGGARFMAWIGVYSYAIYLWHVTAQGILGREIGGRILAWNGGAISQGTWVAITLVVTAGAVVAGVAATRVVEWPVLRLRDRFFPSRSGSLPAVNSPETAPIMASNATGSQFVTPPATGETLARTTNP